MDVELYVYDLSGGMARQYSVALTGVYIDAIYHTAVVLGGVEYFFGQGVHRKIPGSTHHGRPMEILKMGRTDLPLDLIEEYIQSLESIYTPESYDLFMHNCNNFSQDLCMFLVGKSIPEKISSLPETFLKTPIGQMMRGQIDQSMRRMTQAPDAVSGRNAISSPVTPRNINGLSREQPNGVPSNRPTFINSVSQNNGAQTQSRHVHYSIKLPVLKKRIAEPILATTSPPLDKLLNRIETAQRDQKDVQSLKDLAEHIKLRDAEGSASAPLPDMQGISAWIVSNFETCDDAQFALVDLLRIAATDSRVSAYLATDPPLLRTIYSRFAAGSSEETPYNLHFTSLQLCMNMFSSNVAQEAVMDHENEVRSLTGDLVVAGLLRQNSKIRFQAGLLLTNLAAIDHNQRLDGRDDLVNIHTMADGAVESALVQAVIEERDQGTLGKLLLVLGLMLYLAPEDASIRQLCEAMEVAGELKRQQISKESVAQEVLSLLKPS